VGSRPPPKTETVRQTRRTRRWASRVCLLLGAALVQAEELRRVVAERQGAEGRGTIDVAVRGMGDVMDQHENLQELLTRLNNIRDSMEEALGDIKGIEDDYRRGLLEAHIRGAIREINAQITELVSQRQES
jgi:hypothetical protein